MPESTAVLAINRRNLRRGSVMATPSELEPFPKRSINHIKLRSECPLMKRAQQRAWPKHVEPEEDYHHNATGGESRGARAASKRQPLSCFLGRKLGTEATPGFRQHCKGTPLRGAAQQCGRPVGNR